METITKNVSCKSTHNSLTKFLSKLNITSIASFKGWDKQSDITTVEIQLCSDDLHDEICPKDWLRIENYVDNLVYNNKALYARVSTFKYQITIEYYGNY